MLNPQMNSRGAVKHRPRSASVAEPTISPDSLLEGNGFEPSVPGTKEPIFVAEGELRDRTGAAKKGCFLCGTDGSNPSPSSRQSVSLPQSFSKVENPAFRAGLGCWLGDRVGRDA